MPVKIILLLIVTHIGLSNSTFRTFASKVPCSRLEREIFRNGTRKLIDVDYFWPNVKNLKSDLENDIVEHIYGTEGSELFPIFYKRCGGTAKRLTQRNLKELILFLLKNQAAGRSLHHFTALNCPLFNHNQKRYVLESSGIQLCYFIFDNHDCC
ncbi:hypothetical protein KQX54_020753 [Cotesia glomerata]|uniref:Uncharacterized protein n=1 Tax=Cotesia glomerata TaxID=32391 RepID=A0AAV7I0D2_COTGL|nr:hypothetical protein KQX54_020753 [Cotesia glomerata]